MKLLATVLFVLFASYCLNASENEQMCLLHGPKVTCSQCMTCCAKITAYLNKRDPAMQLGVSNCTHVCSGECATYDYADKVTF